MNPFDVLKPPMGTPDDPLAMNYAMADRPISEIFADAPDVPPSATAMDQMFDPMSSEQIMTYDPQAGHSIPWADGRGDMGAMPSMLSGNAMERDVAMEQAYLQQAMQERDTSREMSDKTAMVNDEEERQSRGKLGL